MKLIHNLITTLGLLAFAAILTNSLPGCAPETQTEAAADMAPKHCDEPKPSSYAAPLVEAVPEPVVQPEIPNTDSLLFKPLATPEKNDKEVELAVEKTELNVAPVKSELSVVESTTCLNVEKRIPEGVSTHFTTNSGAVWAYVRVNNPGNATHIQMLWKRDNEVRAQMRLRVGKSPRWRTWSRMRLRQFDVGEWTVEVRDDDGLLIHELLFDVKGPTHIKS